MTCRRRVFTVADDKRSPATHCLLRLSPPPPSPKKNLLTYPTCSAFVATPSPEKTLIPLAEGVQRHNAIPVEVLLRRALSDDDTLPFPVKLWEQLCVVVCMTLPVADRERLRDAEKVAVGRRVGVEEQDVLWEPV